MRFARVVLTSTFWKGVGGLSLAVLGGAALAGPIPPHDGDGAPAPAHVTRPSAGHTPAPAKRLPLKAPVPVGRRAATQPVPAAHSGKAGAPAKTVVAVQKAALTKPLPAYKGSPPVKGPLKKAVTFKTPVLVPKAVAKPVAFGKAGATFDRKAVQAKYDAMSALVMRRDGAGLAKYFLGMTSKGFVFVDKKGRRFGRAKLVAQLKAQMRAVKRFQRSGNKVVGFAVGKNGATVSVVSDFAMVFPPDARSPKGTTITGQSTTRDTWRKEAGGWKLASIRTLRESVKINGKPM